MTIESIIHNILHLNLFISQIVSYLGWMSYLLLFLVVFCETGLVVTPFLPGDSLLFAVGTITATGRLNLTLIIILLILAAFCGDQCNYWVGRKFSKILIHKNWIKTEYIDKTEVFYKKHGNKTLVIARFIPIIRTFAPFVAGVGKMNYYKYLTISLLSAILWVTSITLCGHFFGNIPIVKQNFSVAILVIILISVILGIFIGYKENKKNKK